MNHPRVLYRQTFLEGRSSTAAGTLNWPGVSRVLKSGDEAMRSSSVCRKTLWNSSISGRLPKRDSIWEGGDRS
uniref:Uncharacterized protein n=1 Tax=Anguilla anguilla TaxID=7936 RepID=A0A0E9RUS7_ANGAN